MRNVSPFGSRHRLIFASHQTAREPNSSFSPESSLLLIHFSPSPSQTRHFWTQYLPSTRSPPPPASRFDLSLLWRSEKIRGLFASALTNISAKLGNLVEYRVGFFRSHFPERVSSSGDILGDVDDIVSLSQT
ncbi:unnamed protein product [Brassica rapa]|uniref:Uncharacterized protein n=2 Tax=Brassica campestris TaxID=3711 RepID=A0A8D9M8N5_BRACM|nr:unnamed protein product [Brassica rapa]